MKAISNVNETNRDAIISYLEAGGEGVELMPKQKELYERWKYADEMLRRNTGKKNREEIANMIRMRWDIAICTAYQDIVNAEHVFASSSPLNKKYFIQRRMEFLEKQIQAASIEGDHLSVAQLEKVLHAYVKIYPDFIPARSPKKIVFITNNNLMISNRSPEQAMLEADAVIKEMEGEDDFR